MPGTWEECIKSAEVIQNMCVSTPRAALVLGSGLGFFSRRLTDAVTLPYREIPGFPPATLKSQAGVLYAGCLSGRQVLLFSGRFHPYEGLSFAEAAHTVRVLKVMGVDTLLLTNAAGSLNPGYAPGSLMMISDHLNFSAKSPCTGANDERFGPRFFDMTRAYDPELRALAAGCAEQAGVTLFEGVYAYMSGPQFETPAEIRALRLLGADAVGMSTVPEVIEAAHCGIRTLGISCLTNFGAGLTGALLSDEEVHETAARSSEQFSVLLQSVVGAL